MPSLGLASWVLFVAFWVGLILVPASFVGGLAYMDHSDPVYENGEEVHRFHKLAVAGMRTGVAIAAISAVSDTVLYLFFLH